MSQIFGPESEKNAHSITAATKDDSVNHVTSSNRVLAFIQWHYGTTTNNRTPEQIEKERYLYGDVVFNRWLLMPAAVLIQFCCGSLYAWSVFNSMIDLHISGDKNAGLAPNTFSIAVGMFGLSSATMGPWLERNGPRKGAILSASLFYLGNLIAAMAIHFKQMWLLYIGYGIIEMVPRSSWTGGWICSVWIRCWFYCYC
ncbi:hypothetical protein K7432_012657 [Basidiobolus ranarum]|uniref:Major facilitator superfamily (MFS) profile domain-containing protein n=1 Tax=Basidiobolus ranarum TaxID=34480 RepID=A0ABR2VS36_9FUNG